MSYREAKCCVEGCDSKVGDGARKMCPAHYRRWLKRGTTEQVKFDDGRSRHAMHGTWSQLKRRGKCCSAWTKDFWGFVDCCGSTPPSHLAYIAPLGGGLAGPGNWKWVEVMTRSERNKREKIMLRNSHLKRKFGLSIEGYDEMLRSQNGVCAICGQPEKSKFKGEPRPLAVDHCHETGSVRALLCSNCNTSLGGFMDSVEIMQSAIEYIKSHKKDVAPMC